MDKNSDQSIKKKSHPITSKLEIDEVIRSIQQIDREIEKLVFEKEASTS